MKTFNPSKKTYLMCNLICIHIIPLCYSFIRCSFYYLNDFANAFNLPV